MNADHFGLCVPALVHLIGDEGKETRRCVIRAMGPTRATVEMNPDDLPRLRAQIVLALEPSCGWDSAFFLDGKVVGTGTCITRTGRRGLCIAKLTGARAAPGLGQALGVDRLRLVAH